MLSKICACAEPVVQTTKGKVQGSIMKTFTDKSFYAFMGIPFAKPPVGELRFQPPQTPDPWEGIFDDRGTKRKCIQVGPSVSEDESEDCLYLNVYTPKDPSKKENVSLPVMYVIYGGAYQTGSAVLSSFGPHYLMDYDVIVVTVNYRVGFFGFLSTGDLTCPGNNGLKDQVMGLKWVQENIEQFGGDPKKVTIFGESAGAASVGIHLVSPQSKGLFRGAIQDSGSVLSSFILQRKPKELAFKFARRINSSINKETTTSEDLLKFFRTLDVSQYKKAYNELFGSGLVNQFYLLHNGNIFSGVIESNHDSGVLVERPYEQLVSGNFNIVPTLIGVNSGETLFLMTDEYFEHRVKLYDEHPILYVPHDMNLNDVKVIESAAQDILKIYVNNTELHENLGQALKYFSDDAFVRPSIKQAMLQSKFADVYYYEFAFMSKPVKKIPSKFNSAAGGVIHGGEMPYLFHKTKYKNPFTKPKEDIITMKRMLTMWTNFVKYLNPTPQPLELLQNITWPKISAHPDKPYLCINETLDIKHNFKKSMITEYERLYKLYAIPPLKTF